MGGCFLCGGAATFCVWSAGADGDVRNVPKEMLEESGADEALPCPAPIGLNPPKVSPTDPDELESEN